MTDFPTPRGFLVAVEDIKSAPGLMKLLFQPQDYACFAIRYESSRPAGTVVVGSYSAEVLGPDLAQTMRADLKGAVERAGFVPRGTKRRGLESTSYEKISGNAGRRGV